MRNFCVSIACILIIFLLFAGCQGPSSSQSNPSAPTVPTVTDPPSTRHNYEQYGFCFDIAGKVTEVGAGTLENPTFETDIGYLQFIKQEITEADTVKNAHQLATNLANQMNGTMQLLENDDFFVVYGPIDADYNQKHMVSYYLHQYGKDIWVIICANTVQKFDQAAIINVCMSAEFYK